MGTLHKNVSDFSSETRLAAACGVLLVVCSDYRHYTNNALQRHFHQKRGSREVYDLIALPGACHRLAREPEEHRSLLLQDIATLIDLHRQETIVLVQHKSCGKYGPVLRTESRTEDEVLEGDARFAARILRRRFSGIIVLAFIAEMDGEFFSGMTEIDLSTPSSDRHRAIAESA